MVLIIRLRFLAYALASKVSVGLSGSGAAYEKPLYKQCDKITELFKKKHFVIFFKKIEVGKI